MAQSRRALLGTALAAAGTAAVSAPALAAVSPGADAALLRACAAFHATWEQRERVWATDGSDAQADPFTVRIGDLAQQIARLPAATHPGKEAKAHVASLLAPRMADGTIGSDGITEGVLWSIVADLTGKPHTTAAYAAEATPTSAGPNPDVELIALCGEYVALDREWCRLSDENAPLLAGDPRSDEIGRLQDPIEARKCELEEEIADWTAETPAGLRALAQAARYTLSSDARHGAVDLIHGTDVAWAVLDSVLAMLDARVLA